MTSMHALKAAHRINSQAAYGITASHCTLADGTVTITVKDMDRGVLGTFTTVEEARTAAGL